MKALTELRSKSECVLSSLCTLSTDRRAFGRVPEGAYLPNLSQRAEPPSDGKISAVDPLRTHFIFDVLCLYVEYVQDTCSAGDNPQSRLTDLM